MQQTAGPGRRSAVRPGRFLPAGICAALLALTAFISGPARPASAQIFEVALVDPTSNNFVNSNGDLLNVAMTLLANSDGIPGNGSTNIDIDTVYTKTGQVVWFGIGAENNAGPITATAVNYGTSGATYGSFPTALCGDNNGDNVAFTPTDVCKGMNGAGTPRLVIPDAGNQLAGIPPQGGFTKLGVGLEFQCPPTPGIAHVFLTQTLAASPVPVFNFFVVCMGQVTGASLSTTRTKLEIMPQAGSTSVSVVRVQIFDQAGGPAPSGLVTWGVNTCSVNTAAVSSLTDILHLLQGYPPPELTKPDVGAPKTASSPSFTYGFDNDGFLKTEAFAIIRCEPEHAPGATPGQVFVTADVNSLDGGPVLASIVLNLVGPPSQIKVVATPAQVQCGEKVSVAITIADDNGTPVSDNTPVRVETNYGGTVNSGIFGLLGRIAPISGNTATTFNGVANTFLLTNTQNVGTYQISVTVPGYITAKPLAGAISITCYKADNQPAAAPTAPPTQSLSNSATDVVYSRVRSSAGLVAG